MNTQDPILIEATIAADYLREHTNFAEAIRILDEAAFVTLLPFCDRAPYRYNIGEPFVLGGYLYATDSRICVRAPTSRPDSEGWFPNAGLIFEQFQLHAIHWNRHRDQGLAADGLPLWNPWPPRAVFVQTEDDAQTGIVCPICRGEGDYYVDGDAVSCVYCDRSGFVERFDNVRLGNPFDATSPLIAGRYWALIAQLPDVWWREPKDESAPLYFRFRGGEGALMPIAKEAHP